MATNAALGGAAPPEMTLRRVVIAATIGNVLEWFDFVIYGFLAVTLAQVFFPTGDPTVSLLVTFGAFGLAYLVRPLGAIFVGSYTDKHGRKAGLTLSIALMMLGTTLMALTPSYAAIGIAAPVLITLARLLQGFSVGGEFGSSVAFLMEHGSQRRGFAASWQFSVAGLITVIASLFGVALNTLLSHDQLLSWGWRLPYIFGMLVGPAGLYIRSRLAETPEFLEAEQPEGMRIGELLSKHPLTVVLAIGASIISNSSFYILLYIPTYGQKTLHLPAYTGFVATLVGGIVLAVGAPLFGHWSDKIARPRIMVVAAWLFVLTSWPCFFLMASWPTLSACIFACAWLQLSRRLQWRAAVAAGRAVPGRDPCDRRVAEFQYGGDDLRRLRAVHRDLADSPDRDRLSPSFYLVATAAMSAAALAMIQLRSTREVQTNLAASSA